MNFTFARLQGYFAKNGLPEILENNLSVKYSCNSMREVWKEIKQQKCLFPEKRSETPQIKSPKHKKSLKHDNMIIFNDILEEITDHRC